MAATSGIASLPSVADGQRRAKSHSCFNFMPVMRATHRMALSLSRPQTPNVLSRAGVCNSLPDKRGQLVGSTSRCSKIGMILSKDRRRSVCWVQAQAENKGGEEGAEPSTSEDAEARLEALERGVKRKKGAQTVVADARLRAKKNEPAPGGLAEWKEGKLFPEGWDKMPLPQKLYELYTGKRGFLYWSAQSAWYSVFILGFGWVVFRFVLPALGIYQLTNDLASPPNQ